MVVLAVSACGGTTEKSTSTSKSTETTSEVSSGNGSVDPGGDASESTGPVGGSQDSGAFCDQLVSQSESVNAKMAALATDPSGQVAADIEKENAAIFEAAPPEIKDAVAAMSEISALSAKVLVAKDPEARAAATAAAGKKAADPASTAAFAEFSSWVSGNCPLATASEILGTP